MWITNGARKGRPKQALVSDEFIQARIQDDTRKNITNVLSNLVTVLSTTFHMETIFHPETVCIIS